jgi:hypothetical protein
MSEDKRLFEVEIFKYKTFISPNSIQYGAKFKNDLLPEDYGIQRFISKVGEVAILYLLRDGFPEGYNSIREVLSKQIVKRKKVNNFTGSWIGINDAVRYFADLSPQGYIWHWEYMRQLDPIFINNSYYEIITRDVHIAKNVNITFSRWLALTEDKKEVYMSYFLDNAIDGREEIPQYIYDFNLN